MYKNGKMFGKNFFTDKKLFIYLKNVFQVRQFYTHDTNETRATMLRTWAQAHRKQNSQCFCKGELRSSKVNLQERLSLIRQDQTKQLSVTEFKNLSVPLNQEKNIAVRKNGKERQDLVPNYLTNKGKSNEKELVPSMEYTDKQIKLHSFDTGQVLPHRKLTINERLALRKKQPKIEVNDFGGLKEFSVKVPKNSTSLKPNKEVSNVTTINIKKEDLHTKQLSQETKLSSNLKPQNLKKFAEQKQVKSKNNNNKVQKNESVFSVNSTLSKNILPIANILEQKKHSIQDGHQSGNILKSIPEMSSKDLVEATTIDKIIDLPIVPDTESDINLKSVDADLELIEMKMKSLTINEVHEATDLNRKRKLTYNIRLKNLKNFVSGGNFDHFLSAKRFNIFKKTTEYLPIVDRHILKSKRLSQQKRLLSTSSSISDLNREQSVKNIASETDCEEVKLVPKDLPNVDNQLLDNTKDENVNNDLSSNDLRRVLNKLKSKQLQNIAHTTNTDVTKESFECKQITVQNYDEIQSIHEKFPFPKNALNNYYHLLSEQLKDKSLKVEPYYKLVKNKHISEWNCTYHLKWPENCKISAQALTKKRASSFAALRCLALLSECEKMSRDGLPLLYTKDDVKQLTQKKQTELTFDDNIINKMKNIINIFNNNMSLFINKMDYNRYVDQGNNIVDEEVASVNVFMTKTPIYLGMQQYLAKEKFELPITKLKESFINLIENNNCVIVKGQPGCGKSTRVPQYVLESWVRGASSGDQLCRIAVTQPRRIAAISLAEHVTSERDEELGRVVGYQVRLKSNFQPKTGRILYCTTGILLRHLQRDPNLTTFSHVILDEAHERDINTDLLMNLLKRAMKENNNLKVIVMSATIDAESFSEYFEGAPVFNVPGFTYPVTRHFLDSCKLDLSKTLKMCNGENPRVIHEDVVEVLGYIHKNKPEGAILTFLPGWEDLVKVQKLIPPKGDVVVHLVHSKLKDSEQYKIFARPPPGVRKIILSTNIAETSITIDDVVYVVDAGLHKDQNFDNDKGINVIDMEWISKANANQRAGRAGRCSPGESYHLYPKEKFSQFPDYSSPKILNSSLTKIVLDSKMFSNNMDACDFMNSLVTPPEKIAVERAVDELKQLELLDENEKLTPLGRTLVNFQLEPNLAKAMVNAVVFKCTTPIVDIVTLFSSDTGIFGSLNLTDKDRIKDVKSQFCKSSDHLALMRVYEKWLELCEEEDSITANRFCRDTRLVPYKMEFVNKLKNIHFGYLYNGLYESMPVSEDFSDNDELVKAVLYSGTGTVLEHRNWDIVKNRLKTNANILVTRNNHKATITSESVNYKRHKYPSNFLVYINETRSNIRRTTIVRECSLIPAVSVLLFSNKELEILKADPKTDGLSDNLVIIGIKNTKLQFLCDKTHADILMDCKKAIETSYKCLIHQLTYAGEEIPEFLEHWDNVLRNLGSILDKYRIE